MYICGLSLTLPYFSTSSHKVCDFWKKDIEHTKCVLIFSTAQSEIFLIPRRIERDIITNVRRSLCQIPFMCVFLNINITWILSTDFRIILWKSDQWKLSYSMWKDRRTDMTKVIVALRNFTNALKIMKVTNKMQL